MLCEKDVRLQSLEHTERASVVLRDAGMPRRSWFRGTELPRRGGRGRGAMRAAPLVRTDHFRPVRVGGRRVDLP
jgi:hypothetical protein